MKPFQRSTHTLFFAYGSNLVPDQILTRCTKPDVVGVARLPDHRMGFYGFSKVWDGAVETVVPSPGDEVWGLVYRLTIADSNRLDTWQDVRLDGTGAYFHFPTEVFDDDAVAHPVLLYKKDILGEPRLPSRPYLSHILRGAEARRLPDRYMGVLAAQPTKEASYEVPQRGTFDRSLLVDMACGECG